MFFSSNEQLLIDEYISKGYIIRPVADMDALIAIRDQFATNIYQYLGKGKNTDSGYLLNNIHELISVEKLNDFRLNQFKEINKIASFRANFFQLIKPYINKIVGNELAMQKQVNLSIQLPQDDSSLLPVHADTWSGDSPYEVVAWLPLVDCYKTKSMYMLPPKATEELHSNFSKYSNSEILFQDISDKVEWLNVKFGEVLIFNQALPHGNRINQELETRWSMNCRFKGIFTPYSDKKLGEFFQPITLRPASLAGMNYKYPAIK